MCKCDVSLWGNLIDFALTKNVKKRAVHTFSIAQIGQNKRARTAQMVDVCARHRSAHSLDRGSSLKRRATAPTPCRANGSRVYHHIIRHRTRHVSPCAVIVCVQHNLRTHITVQHSAAILKTALSSPSDIYTPLFAFLSCESIMRFIASR